MATIVYSDIILSAMMIEASTERPTKQKIANQTARCRSDLGGV